MKNIAAALAVVLMTFLFTGCAAAAYAAVADFDDGKAVVEVKYGMFGPKQAKAASAALPQAQNHCQTLGKDTAPVSVRTRQFDAFSGVYIFLYRCEGPDRVTVVSEDS